MSDQRRSELNPLLQLKRLGQSIWYDFVTRDLLVSGGLARLISEDGLQGTEASRDHGHPAIRIRQGVAIASYASVLFGIEAKVGALAAR